MSENTFVDHSALEQSTPALKSFYDDRRLMYRNAFWYLFGASAGGFGFNTVQSLMPMHMAKMGMGPELISLVLSLRSWIYAFLVLYIAHVSDHWQSRMGRRLPFLIISLPFLVIGMVIFPLIKSTLICVVVFSIFALFVGIKWDTYPLLSYDLFRQKYWGRIAGIGGIAGGFAVWIGQVILMPMVDTHGEEFVYCLAALFLLLSTLLTLIFVREPPLHPAKLKNWNPWSIIVSTIKVGFSRSQNVILFIGFVLLISPNLVLNYISVQGQMNLGLTQGEVGRYILQWGTLVSMILFPIIGVCMDRFGAVRICIFAYACTLIACWFGYHPKTVHELAIASTFITVASGVTYTAATIFVASGIERENIATFCACNGAVTSAVTAILLPICGTLIKRVFGGNYGSIFLIASVLAGFGLLILLWLDQKRRVEAKAEIIRQEALIQLLQLSSQIGSGIGSLR
jgi:MFS family permease